MPGATPSLATGGSRATNGGPARATAPTAARSSGASVPSPDAGAASEDQVLLKSLNELGVDEILIGKLLIGPVLRAAWRFLRVDGTVVTVISNVS